MLISTQNVSMTTICNKTKQKILRKSVWLQNKQNITHHHSLHLYTWRDLDFFIARSINIFSVMGVFGRDQKNK